ncbi:putative 5-oxoprolinase [Cucurbitaria berberidis CBS 394.84]|uniref:5-oxoprolinase n=1 Tax=Cucurbitaria berberidis CBS 394.84 TaxID=1168544 RepID=A0A9P4GGT5_9PLEO|nr:putative 5-oxoprolinase [Cucurbitaria berberidis CBS 394.84]KAF1845295.1 putative 5-oxoprolinase [Cucurbitaria berberidis CBS 394.84]
MMPARSDRPLRISIDRGGTFTDCIARVQGQADTVIKILSVDKKNYPDAPTEAIRQVLEKFYDTSIPRGAPLNLNDVEWIRMGTTVATNALLERKGEKTAFLVTEGFKEILVIGNQSRPFMFDLSIRRPEVLYSDVFEVEERIVPATCADSELRRLAINYPDTAQTVSCASGESIQIVKALDVKKTKEHLTKLHSQGYRSIAVCLMHSYIFPDYEIQIREIAQEIGFENISLSHEVSQRSKIVPRGNSTVVDAYLTPEIERYLRQFTDSFPDLDKSDCRIEFMQSDGGLVPSSDLSGLHSILSGPAGGVVGYAETCYDKSNKVPVIGFDMGGTSTDVSRYDGEFEHVFETTTAGIPIHVPQLDVNTIAAGGGSILTYRDGLMMVGPESASSSPGPACYRNGGPLTVTDANLALGRLIPEHFPSVFGPNENEPLDRNIVLTKFEELTDLINRDTGRSLSWTEVASGYLKVANQAMCGPIRSLTEARGHDVSRHDLASFGGAGGQHACDIAEILGVRRVVIHKYSSILSAYGIGLADVVHEEQRTCVKNIDTATQAIYQQLRELAERAKAHPSMQKFPVVEGQQFLSMRYDGSETLMMIRADEGIDSRQTFIEAHHQQFGFTPANRAIFVDTVRVRATGRYINAANTSFEFTPKIQEPIDAPKPYSTKEVYFTSVGWKDIPIYMFNTLRQGNIVAGPALIVDKTQTIVVTPNASAVLSGDNLILNVEASKKESLSASVIDPVQLSVFRHRFFGIAEQMGRVLRNVSVSANIKERLDFSCAIFSPDGSLVANAPHVPAMIGSMAFAVKSQIEEWKGKLKDGDVLLSNSPRFGGVHLPDLTLTTPVFDAEGKEIIFWAASRGHHADVGGIMPGSMPPNSRFLWEEGAVFDSILVVRDGKIAEDELHRILCVEPAKYPNSSGSRCFQENVTDIKAQIAANYCGIRLVRLLIVEYTMDVVQAYMNAIQDAAELAIRNLFKRLAKDFEQTEIGAIDYMDDGTPIQLKVTIRDDGSAIFDFTGTGTQVHGNWNAPEAITNSSVLYALRCMVGNDVPLNQGCIKPIDLIIPDNSLLRPKFDAAVCAGNVLTSQRIVDVIFKAFNVCAASQGCMNNFTFGINGTDGFGYYETIGGGSGAGPTWHGTSGVHTNMTNTRITDPESLERRYPVILKRFGLRPHSGGKGKHPGGDGLVRDVQFRMPMSAAMLSERRAFAPYGMKGGEEGKRGSNTWVKTDGTLISIGGKNSISVQPGDRLVIETPGGGGYGATEALA